MRYKIVSNESFEDKFYKIFHDYKIIGTYVNNKTSILIEDNFGNKFLCSPQSLMRGSYPSIKTVIDKDSYFKFLCNNIHNNLYFYDNLKYINATKKIEITCSDHGSFYQRPNDHLSGYGCPKCGNTSASKKRLKSHSLYLTQAKNVHNNYYSYPNTKYSGTSNKIKIECPIHGEFEQNASDHLRGGGCIKCNTHRFSRSNWIDFCTRKNRNTCTCYIIRCFNESENFIKIGITSESVNKRFDCNLLMPYSFEILKEFKGSSDFIWDKEKELHRKFKNYNYLPKIHFGGRLECFNIDIIESI